MQCRAEIPHLKKVMAELADTSVALVSINTRDPEKVVDAEIKRYEMAYPVFYGRDQNITKEFKVLKLPRLILVNADGTIYKDVDFMKAEELKAEIVKLLAE
jgi:thiol-disulfide isomerase/thioredoxin